MHDLLPTLSYRRCHNLVSLGVPFLGRRFWPARRILLIRTYT